MFIDYYEKNSVSFAFYFNSLEFLSLNIAMHSLAAFCFFDFFFFFCSFSFVYFNFVGASSNNSRWIKQKQTKKMNRTKKTKEKRCAPRINYYELNFNYISIFVLLHMVWSVFALTQCSASQPSHQNRYG